MTAEVRFGLRVQIIGDGLLNATERMHLLRPLLRAALHELEDHKPFVANLYQFSDLTFETIEDAKKYLADRRCCVGVGNDG